MAQKLENLIDKDLLADYDDELKKTYLAGGVVFDISAHKATGSPATPATFADLTAALGTNGANIPQNMRKGGMTVKFIKGSAQSQSNKYVQYRLTSQTFSTSEADWECIADQVAFALTKVLTVDFLQNQDTVQWTNMYGNVTIVAAAGINVATLKISHGSVLEQVVTLGTTDIDILDGEVVTLKITRTTDLQDAVVTLKMVKTAAE